MTGTVHSIFLSASFRLRGLIPPSSGFIPVIDLGKSVLTAAAAPLNVMGDIRKNLACNQSHISIHLVGRTLLLRRSLGTTELVRVACRIILKRT